MNKKEKLVERLKTFRLRFEEQEDNIIVNFHRFIVTISFKDNCVSINAITKGWNQISDFLELNIDKAFVYLMFKLNVLTLGLFCVVYFNKETLNTYLIILISILFLLYILMKFSFYLSYRLRLELFKKQIVEWLE